MDLLPYPVETEVEGSVQRKGEVFYITRPSQKAEDFNDVVVNLLKDTVVALSRENIYSANGHKNRIPSLELMAQLHDTLVCILADLYGQGSYNNKCMHEGMRGIKETASENWECLSSEVNQAIDEIIYDLRSNWRIPQPTKYEQILEIGRSTGRKGFTLEDLLPLFSNASYPEKAAATALAKLQDKLKEKQLKLERVSVYKIAQLIPEN